MDANAPVARVIRRVALFVRYIGCIYVAVVSGDDVLSSFPDGSVSGVVLFSGVGAFWLVDVRWSKVPTVSAVDEVLRHAL